VIYKEAQQKAFAMEFDNRDESCNHLPRLLQIVQQYILYTIV